MTIEVDDADYSEYRRFCFRNSVKIKTVYDYDYGILVSIPGQLVFKWIVYITIGEEV